MRLSEKITTKCGESLFTSLRMSVILCLNKRSKNNGCFYAREHLMSEMLKLIDVKLRRINVDDNGEKKNKKKQVILKKDKTLTLPSYFWRNWA